jgi:hypothetical protein
MSALHQLDFEHRSISCDILKIQFPKRANLNEKLTVAPRLTQEIGRFGSINFQNAFKIKVSRGVLNGNFTSRRRQVELHGAACTLDPWSVTMNTIGDDLVRSHQPLT